MDAELSAAFRPSAGLASQPQGSPVDSPFLIDGFVYGALPVGPAGRPRHMTVAVDPMVWRLEDELAEMRAAMQANMAEVRLAVRTVAEQAPGVPRPCRKTRPGFYTVQEAAEIVRAPVSSVRGWIYDGRLPAKKVGKRVLIAVGDLARFTGQPG